MNIKNQRRTNWNSITRKFCKSHLRREDNKNASPTSQAWFSTFRGGIIIFLPLWIVELGLLRTFGNNHSSNFAEETKSLQTSIKYNIADSSSSPSFHLMELLSSTLTKDLLNWLTLAAFFSVSSTSCLTTVINQTVIVLFSTGRSCFKDLPIETISPPYIVPIPSIDLRLSPSIPVLW